MKKYIWEGAVGVMLEPKPSKNGEYFWTFEFVRCFKEEGNHEMRYAKSFSERNAEALGTALSKAFQYMSETTADRHVANVQLAV